MEQLYESFFATLIPYVIALGAIGLVGDALCAWAKRRRREKRRREYQDRRLANDAEHARVTRAMRYDVLRRDNFRCVRCGRGREDGVKLHVDHIVPVSRGGKSTMSNLQTLCEDCNLGKGSRYLE